MTTLLKDNSSILDDLELVILDKDGTIIDIHHYWGFMITKRADLIIKTWLPAYEKKEDVRNHLIDSMGIDLVTCRMKPEGPIGIKPRPYIVSIVKKALATHGANKTEKEIEAIFKKVDAITSNDILPLLRLLPFVEIFLDQCMKNNVKLAVATNDISSRAEMALKALCIDQYFDTVIGGDQVSQVKPSSDMVDKIIEVSGVNKKNTVMIGDHPVDVQMGINSGLGCCIGVLTGLANPEEFSSYINCHVINSFSALRLI